MQKNLQRKGDENFLRLATLLQQPGRSTRPRGPGKDASFLHQKRHRHLERCGKPPRGELALPIAGDDRERRRSL